MGKRMPFFRSGDEVQFIDLCQQVSYDSGILLTKLFQNVHHEGRYLAAGGYCPVQDVLESTAQDARLDGVRFDSLLTPLILQCGLERGMACQFLSYNQSVKALIPRQKENTPWVKHYPFSKPRSTTLCRSNPVRNT